MKTCQVDGCVERGRAYYLAHGVVHADVLPGATAQVYTGRDGDGWFVLCGQHALRLVGVAFP